jgi:hypothetical protein
MFAAAQSIKMLIEANPRHNTLPTKLFPLLPLLSAGYLQWLLAI